MLFSGSHCSFKSMTIVLVVYGALKTYCLTASYLYMCIYKVELFSGRKNESKIVFVFGTRGYKSKEMS